MSQAAQEKIIQILVEKKADTRRDPYEWTAEVLRHLAAFTNRMELGAIRQEQAHTRQMAEAVGRAAVERNYRVLSQMVVPFVQHAAQTCTQLGPDMLAFFALGGEEHSKALAPGRCGAPEVEAFLEFLGRYEQELEKHAQALEAQREKEQRPKYRVVSEQRSGHSCLRDAQRAWAIIECSMSLENVEIVRHALKGPLASMGMDLVVAE